MTSGATESNKYPVLSALPTHCCMARALGLLPSCPQGDKVTTPRKEMTGNTIFLTFRLNFLVFQCLALHCAEDSSLHSADAGHTESSGECDRRGRWGHADYLRKIMSEAEEVPVDFLLNKRCFLIM